MHHIIRMNVRSKGYGLFLTDSAGYHREAPLDVESQGITSSYLSAQRRIDKLLSDSFVGPHICISYLGQDSSPTVTYGCYFPIQDEHGRGGLSFIHALQDPSRSLTDLVLAVVQMLRPISLEELASNLALVAGGSFSAADFISSVASRSEFSPRNLDKVSREVNPIKSIVCDCAGSGMAWLAMSASHVSTPPAWEIYEEYSAFAGAFLVTSTVTGASRTYKLSQYIRNAVNDTAAVEEIVLARTELVSPGEHPRRSEYVQGASPSLVKSPLTTDWTTQSSSGTLLHTDDTSFADSRLPSEHHSSRNMQSLEDKVEGGTSTSALSSQISTLPRRGHIVELEYEEEPRPDRLRVNDGSRMYIVTLQNVLGARRYDAYYVIEVGLFSVLSRTNDPVNLVMLRATMTKEARAHVEMFLRNIHGVQRNMGSSERSPGSLIKFFMRRS